MSYQTEQEQFWSGTFGDEYIERNCSERIIANNTALFARILSRTLNINSVAEFGANIGLNLVAIKNLIPSIQCSAIEINKKAIDKLTKLGGVKVYHQSILETLPDIESDLVLVKGVLIHINPDFLHLVYQNLYSTSNKYICLVEYYHPTPVEALYRGHQGKLFKRDFTGEMLDLFQDLKLVDYGFVYHRDNVFPQGDCTWFLLEKTSR